MLSPAVRSSNARARAAADLANGVVLATVEVAAPPERVFAALMGPEITKWWEGAGLTSFTTTEFTGEVKPGGKWRASGPAADRSYAVEGQFLVVEAPAKLVHTFGPPGMPPSTCTYDVEAIPDGTRITLRHEHVFPREVCIGGALAWESLFARLSDYLAK